MLKVFSFNLMTDYFFLDPLELIEFLEPDERPDWSLLRNESWLWY